VATGERKKHLKIVVIESTGPRFMPNHCHISKIIRDLYWPS
jgi:hypothetical protein